MSIYAFICGVREHICPVCGAKFTIFCEPEKYTYKLYRSVPAPPGSRSKSKKLYQRVLFCRYSCMRKAEAAQLRERERTCPNCKKRFIPDSWNRKYCSEACRKNYTERKYRAEHAS